MIVWIVYGLYFLGGVLSFRAITRYLGPPPRDWTDLVATVLLGALLSFALWPLFALGWVVRHTFNGDPQSAARFIMGETKDQKIARLEQRTRELERETEIGK